MSTNKFFKGLLAFVIFLLIGFSYFAFFVPIRIECAIIRNLGEKGNYNKIEVVYKSGKEKSFYIKKNKQIPDGTGININARGLFIKDIEPSKQVVGKVVKVDDKSVTVDLNTLNFDNEVSFYNDRFETVSYKSIIPGYSNSTFLINSVGKVQSVLSSIPVIENIRVGITDENGKLLQDGLRTFSSQRGLIAVIDGKNTEIKNTESLLLKSDSDKINLYIKGNGGETSLITTKNPVKIYPKGKSAISISEIKRPNGYTPEFSGYFEVLGMDKGLIIVNELDIETYLKYVVPSEIPSDAGLEGYKVQAIAARTYILWETLTGRFSMNGIHAVDTVKSQVYNYQKPTTLSSRAVDETKGLILTYKGSIVDAKYYSTSCGLGAPYNEVWYDKEAYNKSNPKPYIDFRNYTENDIKEITNDEDASKFFKDWTLKSVDSFAALYRWKFSFDIKTLSTNINLKAKKLYKTNPEGFKKKYFGFLFKKAELDENSDRPLGEISDVSIKKRGKAGNVLEIELISDKGVFRVHGQNTITNLFTPEENFEITPLYGRTITSFKNFPSPFYTIDKLYNGKNLSKVTFFGGGFGHGAGMSQYGVIGLSRQGLGYEEIIKTFYKDAELGQLMDKMGEIYK